MKKHLILLLLAGLFTFSSCSSDDDNVEKEETADPILGTWVVTSIDPAEVDATGCEDPSTVTFNADNSGNATFHIVELGCVPTSEDGAWTNEGDNVYTISVPFLGAVTGTVEFSGEDNVTFVTEDDMTITFERQ